MGTYYYLASNEKTKEMVENEDLDAIDEYIQSPEPVQGPYDIYPTHAAMGVQQVMDGYEWIEGAFQIASRAVQLGKVNVLNHIKDKIFFDCIRDGNSYNLFVLATEKHQFDLINLLWDIAVENGQGPVAKEQLGYAMRRLLGYSELEEEDVIKYLPLYIKDGVDLTDIYGYTNSWKKPIVRSWLENNCKKEQLSYNYKYECKHKLVLSDYRYRSDGNWLCNICMDQFPSGTERWFCKPCNTDVCITCYEL